MGQAIARSEDWSRAEFPPDTVWLTVPEAAVYLNVTERFVRRLVTERRIPFHHFGRLVRLHRRDLYDFAHAERTETLY